MVTENKYFKLISIYNSSIYSIGCKNTEQSIHPLNVGFYRSGQPKTTTTQTPLDQIPRTGPPTET